MSTAVTTNVMCGDTIVRYRFDAGYGTTRAATQDEIERLPIGACLCAILTRNYKLGVLHNMYEYAMSLDHVGVRWVRIIRAAHVAREVRYGVMAYDRRHVPVGIPTVPDRRGQFRNRTGDDRVDIDAALCWFANVWDLRAYYGAIIDERQRALDNIRQMLDAETYIEERQADSTVGAAPVRRLTLPKGPHAD